MSTCDKYLELISCYIDGEISDEDRTELEGHLVSCPSCAAFLEAIRDIDLDEDMQEPPEELMDGVKRRIEACGKSKRTKGGRKNILLAAACIALIILAVPALKNLTVSGGGSDMSAEKSLTAQAPNATPFSDEVHDSASNQILGEGAALSGSAGEEYIQSTPPSGSQNYGDSGSGSVKYYAVIYIYKQLPEILRDITKEYIGDGVYHIAVTREIADELIASGYPASSMNRGYDSALVIYSE